MKTMYEKVTNSLSQIIQEMAQNPDQFVKNPRADFKRSRKLTFETMLKMLLAMGAGNLRKELNEYFSYSETTPTASAFVQQRGKLTSTAMATLFERFNAKFSCAKTFKGYQLLAIDGSELAFADRRPHATTYVKTYNKLHLNACYDLCENRYIDIIVQYGTTANERRAFCQLVDRGSKGGKKLFIADRGYESYNCFAHVLENNQDFLIRVKDIESTGILNKLSLKGDTSDVTIERKLTRKRTNEIRRQPLTYKILTPSNTFDYLIDCDLYPMKFRVVRFEISHGVYEAIITTLPSDEFTIEDIKSLYQMRWGIETSFRTLKYTLGLLALHTQKVDFIIQEIYAKLILSNLCQIVASDAVIQQNNTKHEYKLNLSALIETIRYFLSKDKCPRDIVKLFHRYILPIRKERKVERPKKSHVARVPLNYRFV